MCESYLIFRCSATTYNNGRCAFYGETVEILRERSPKNVVPLESTKDAAFATVAGSSELVVSKPIDYWISNQTREPGFLVEFPVRAKPSSFVFINFDLKMRQVHP